MPLSSGARLGPYEIQSAIGAGGMGEVYKALDTRLDRTVAIKILPAELSADPDRRVRFEREARAVAALSHPHICTLHDIGTHDGTTYLVMEYLAGESLADRLLRGPVPLAQALDLAAQIADALDAAHKHGIIHRDLKPGNVMLTSSGAGRSGVTSAKLLDFGLAKLAAHAERPALVADGATAPTMAAPVTAQGTILGTLQYMAPEQLEGKEADARTDLWALGAILYEMLTGKRAFEGESPVSLAGKIMNAEPVALASLQPLTPPALDRVVTKCLAKHPDDRWDTAHDVADELRWISQVSGAAADTRPRRGLGRQATIAAGVLLVGISIGAGVLALLRPAAPVSRPARLSLPVDPAEDLNSGGSGTRMGLGLTPGGSRTALVWTPDGRTLVFVGRRDGVQQIYLRPLDASEARPLKGTEDAQAPAVSRDGRWVAFWAKGAIRKVPLGEGTGMVLVPGIPPPVGLVWDDDGSVFFARRVPDGRIWQIPPEGPPKAVTRLGEGELAHILPWPLPGGRTILYTVRKRIQSWGDEEIVAQGLASGERKRVLTNGVDARYVPTDHLVFLRQGQLVAVPFDPERVEVLGQEVAVLDQVAQALASVFDGDITGAGQFAVGPTGTLAWVPSPVVPPADRRLVAIDRRGQVTPLAAPSRSYGLRLRVSPEGGQLALTIASLTGVGLWLYDLDGRRLTPLNLNGESGVGMWSPEGRRLVLLWLTNGRPLLGSVAADGGAQDPQILAKDRLFPVSFTPDGRRLATTKSSASGQHIVIVDLQGGTATEQPTGDGRTAEGLPEFSPDGRWLAYESGVSGRGEVYVRPYPGPGPARQVSVDGGLSPAWRRDGLELFYVTGADSAGKRFMMAVDFAAGRPAQPRRLFTIDRQFASACTQARCYDVARGGERFYFVETPELAPPRAVTHVNLILNWFEELKAKVPTTR